MPLFIVKPLRWKKKFAEHEQRYTADTPFGQYDVLRVKKDCDKHESEGVHQCDDYDGPWGPWRWEYCFAEYHDESFAECSTVAEGKRLAWEHWQERILPALKPAPGVQL